MYFCFAFDMDAVVNHEHGTNQQPPNSPAQNDISNISVNQKFSTRGDAGNLHVRKSRRHSSLQADDRPMK